MSSAPATPGVRMFGNAAWRGEDLRHASHWRVPLGAAQQAEIVEIGTRLEADGADVMRARTFAQQAPDAAPQLRESMAAIRRQLQDGDGFALMRGFPTDLLSEKASRLAYAAMRSMLGLSMPQNRQGELVHDVRDTGADPRDPDVRLSTTSAEQDFHTDAADVIGLLCLKKSKAGGVSRIVSSVTVYNEVARARPDLADLLFEPWYFHLKGEQAPGTPPWFQLPVAHAIGGALSSFFIGWYIRDAEKLPGVPVLSPERRQVLALYEATANRPDLYLDMEFEPGDVQWLKNSVILHKRTSYEDWPQAERRRHLLRLWIAAPDFADGIAAVRQGHRATP